MQHSLRSHNCHGHRRQSPQHSGLQTAEHAQTHHFQAAFLLIHRRLDNTNNVWSGDIYGIRLQIRFARSPRVLL